MIVTRGYGAGLGGIEEVVLEGPLVGLISTPTLLSGTLIESNTISGTLELLGVITGTLVEEE